MAKGDRVGALYYEVILDPRGFARGATKVKSEQDVMARAVTSTTSKLDKLQAELDAIGMLAIKGSDEHRKVLAKYQRQIISQIEEEREAIKERDRQRHFSWVREQATFRQKRTHLERMRILYRRNGTSLIKWMDMAGKGSGQLAGNLAMAAGLSPQIQGLARALGPVGVKLAIIAAGALAAYKALSAMISIADRFELMEIQLRASLGGSQILTDKLTKSMRDYAKQTAYSTEQMMAFAVQMKSMGVASSRITDNVSLLGNLARGDGEKLKRVAKAYTDVLAKGRLMAQEANQFTEANIPLWQGLEETMGHSRQTLRKMAEDGKITVDHVKTALQYIEKSQNLEEVSKERLGTVAGQWDLMKETITNILATLGEPFRKALVDLLKIVNGVLSKFEAWVEKARPFIDSIEHIYAMSTNIYNVGSKIVSMADQEGRKQEEIAEVLEEKRQELMQQYRVQQEIWDKEEEQYEKIKESLDEQLMTEEELAKHKWDKQLAEAAISEEHRQQLELQKQQVDAELARRKMAEESQKAYLKQQEDIAKAIEDQRKAELETIAEEAKQEREVRDEAQKEIDAINKQALKDREAELKWAKDAEQMITQQRDEKLDKFASAAGGSGPTAGGVSFGSGSTEEYEFLRQMELQARKDAEETKLNKERNARLTDIYRVLSDNLKDIEEKRADDVEDTKFVYGV